jgi:hypothetical protein
MAYQFSHHTASVNGIQMHYVIGYYYIRLMKSLDDAWDSQDWDTFGKRHTEDVVVRWPGQSEPTRGLNAHKDEAVEMFKIFPDNHVENNPYRVLFGSR